MKKWIVWGAGKGFNLINTPDFWESICENNISHIIDKENENFFAGIDIEMSDGKANFQVESTNIMLNIQADSYIIVTTSKYYNEIYEFIIQNTQITADHIYEAKKLVVSLMYNHIATIVEKKEGIEIGGPSAIFSKVYETCNKCDGVNFSLHNMWGNLQDEYIYKNKILGASIVADAADLSMIKNEQYDFLLSSNNIEHIANPIKALKEFKRVVKRKGYLILLLPNKQYTFDHNRQVVTLEHLIKDYENNIGEDDLTHLEEILKNHDLNMDKEAGGYSQFYERSINNYNNRCLHHHVFDESVLKEIGIYLNMKIIQSFKITTNYCIILKKEL